MQQIFIKDTHNLYYAIDVTHQVSSGWVSTLDGAKTALQTSNRSLAKHWNNIANLHIEEVYQYLRTRGYEIIEVISISMEQPYEYW